MVLLLAAAAAAYTGNDFVGSSDPSDGIAMDGRAMDGAAMITKAFAAKRSDVVVEADGVVSKLLSDDNDGARHQRFIVTVARGQTVLIAHNIDVAPRVANVQAGDRISFRGEYEYTERGGVVHWTHHDPGGGRPGGWIRHAYKTYR